LESLPTPPEDSVRLDLWAWSVRLYKTRTLAAAACKKSQLLVNGQRCRASRQVRVGDEVRVRQGLLERILEVKAILRRRVSAKEVEAFLIDLTPAEEYARVAELERGAREGAPIPRETGTGRPTKRDRRDLDEMSGGEPAPEPTFEDFVRAFVRRKPPR
jgi:ribosome-associated heat shock protein Hsp15